MEHFEETDPDGLDAHAPGSKLDNGKAKLFEYVLGYFPNALEAVSVVSEYGAEKYTSMGWSTVDDGYLRYSEALLRHLASDAAAYDWEEGSLDDSGLYHDAQVAWNALARLELRIRQDDIENGDKEAQEVTFVEGVFDQDSRITEVTSPVGGEIRT